MATNANLKELAGRRAAELVRDGMTVGLGTGSTVFFTLVRLAERVRAGELRIRGVPTSEDTAKKARELGIPLATLEEVERIDLTIDGADEIDDRFEMIKGGGGALLREKLIASISTREVIVVGADKLVGRLGARHPLPVEVVPFALPVLRRALERAGSQPHLRIREDGTAYVTDNHNCILDCRFEGGIADPYVLESELQRQPGIVETGLFLGLAHVLVVGHTDGSVTVGERPPG